MVAWDDPAFDAGAFDLAVIRSTWNYYRAPERFLGWCNDTARRTRLLNPPEVVKPKSK